MSQSKDPGKSSTDATKSFICGVCEGFYGKPWTTDQRKELFIRMQRMHMSTYMYAPKDDYKHRLHWRILYEDEEAEDLCELIASAKENNITFVYALSPGLDITYNSSSDITLLQQKLSQVRDFGCEAFALLYDDIEPDLVDEDEETFKSVANAQVSITNGVYNFLGKPDVFLFCPTEYCSTRAVPDLIKSDYLKTLGDCLDKGIDILWTGEKVVSRRITLTCIKEVSALIKRPPIIWDNIHANDYDQTRVYLGPYDGRPVELRTILKGVLTNPNCEFEANYIAMHTLAQWSKNRTENYPAINESGDTEMDTDTSRYSCAGYDIKKALQCAVQDWIPELYKMKKPANKRAVASPEKCGSKQKTAAVHKMEVDFANDSPQRKSAKSQKSQNASSASAKSKDSIQVKQKSKKTCDKVIKRKMEELEPLVLEDILLICDLFYLPYQHGPRAIHLLKAAHWLITNTGKVSDAQKIPKSEHSPEIREWYEKAINFHEKHKDVCLVIDKFVNIPNRDLLYQFHTYISDMRSGMSLVNSYIKWHGMGKPDKEPFRRGEQEPWVNRGGLYSEFRRLLPIEGQNDMFPPPGKLSSGNKVFTIRPFFPEDKDDTYTVCRRCCDNGLDGSDQFPEHPDLVPDECVGCLLQHFPRHCYLLEDDGGLCGYALATPDVHDYHRILAQSWLPAMKLKYPKPSNPTEGAPSISEQTIQTFHKELSPVQEDLANRYPAFLQVQVLSPHVEGLNTPNRLLSACLQSLKAVGVKGVHTVLHANQMYILTFLFKLGFEEVKPNKNVAASEILVLAREI